MQQKIWQLRFQTMKLTGTIANASLSSRVLAHPTLDIMGLSASVSSGMLVECTQVPAKDAGRGSLVKAEEERDRPLPLLSLCSYSIVLPAIHQKSSFTLPLTFKAP